MQVLRKSCGPWSAGTPIEIVDLDKDVATVRTQRRVPVAFEHIPAYSEFDKPKSIITKKDHSIFDVPPDYIVERRSPKDKIVNRNRKARRLTDALVIAKRMAFENR